VRPSFFIIGAPKCGTTSLTDWLSQHPDLWLPEKEIHFFNTDHRNRIRRSLSDYEALFRAGKTCGDSSVWYLYSKAAVPNILAYNPDAKFIVCLRDPVQMAFSLHYQLLYTRDEDATDLRCAWSLEDERRNGRGVKCYEPSHLFYSETCALGRQVERLLARTNNVQFVFLEDMKSDPQAVYRTALNFLGVSPAPVEFEQKNAATKRRSQKVNSIIGAVTAVKCKLGLHGGIGLIRKLDQWNTEFAPWPRDELLETELREYFSNDIKLLAKLTRRDLSNWLRPPH
jgi:hypothetical protein